MLFPNCILLSQCTFWCSVLSDLKTIITAKRIAAVSMHLLVLSAFRPVRAGIVRAGAYGESQCTFWCSVLSDAVDSCLAIRHGYVSMHLLVLSAFRPARSRRLGRWSRRLNAPSGAQCFPTGMIITATGRPSSLNAPSGAQCFPTPDPRPSGTHLCSVSMHLLVLSAFRLLRAIRRGILFPSQCTFWCSVLSDAHQCDRYC